MKTRDNLGELLEEQGILDLPAVEVGVAEGRFSRQILSWGVPFVYLVDYWNPSPGGYAELTSWDADTHEGKMQQTIQNLSGYEGQYELLRGWSYEMCDEIEDGTLGFAFIDASHDYENVLRDLHCYWPKLTANGMMAGHDFPVPGCEKAVREFAKEKDLEIHILPTADINDASYWLERK